MAGLNNNGHYGKDNINYAQKVKTNFKRPDEIDYGRIFRIIKRRKMILVLSVIFIMVLVVLYNTFSKPVYEAKVLLKKEQTDRRSAPDDELANILNLQSPAQIETELELVKTSEVLTKTIEELNLHTHIDRIEKPNGKLLNIDDILLDYNKEYIGQNTNSSYPQFLEVKNLSGQKNFNLFIEKQEGDVYKLYSSDNDSLMQESRSSSAGVFALPYLNITFYWANAEPGSRIYFRITGLSDARKSLNKHVSVEQRAKTDVFEISVEAGSPYAAQVIANTLSDKFRQARIDQQKQTIRYSFDFVDQNLEAIKKKLEDAEKALTEYKYS